MRFCFREMNSCYKICVAFMTELLCSYCYPNTRSKVHNSRTQVTFVRKYDTAICDRGILIPLASNVNDMTTPLMFEGQRVTDRPFEYLSELPPCVEKKSSDPSLCAEKISCSAREHF